MSEHVKCVQRMQFSRKTSTHDVHGRRNCDHHILSKCVEQSVDWSGQIADDDDRCKLTLAYSITLSTVLHLCSHLCNRRTINFL